MKTKLIIPDHLRGEYEKRTGNSGKPIEIREAEIDANGRFDKVDFSDDIKAHSIKNLILVEIHDSDAQFIATGDRFLALYKGHLNNGSYPGLNVTIPEHLKHHLPKPKAVMFVKKLTSNGLEHTIAYPSCCGSVFWHGRWDLNFDLFTVRDRFDKDTVITSTYIGHLNDGYISE